MKVWLQGMAVAGLALALPAGADDTGTMVWAGGESDTWSSTAWYDAEGGADLLDVFYPGYAALFNDDAANKTVTVDADVSAGLVTVNAASDYILAGDHKLAASGLVKQGAGKLTLAGAGLADGSTVTVKAGTFTIDHTSSTIGEYPLGIDSTVIVEAGGTFDLALPSGAQSKEAENNRTRSATFKIAGSGADGAGAIVNSGSDWNAAFSRIELTDDAVIGGPGRVDVRPNVGVATAGYVKGEGKKLTIVNPNYFNVVGGDVLTLEEIIVKGVGIFSVEDNNVTFNVPSGITLTEGGTLLYRYDNVSADVNVKEGDTGCLYADEQYGYQNGKVTVAKDAVLKLDGRNGITLINGDLVNNGEVRANNPKVCPNGKVSGDGYFTNEEGSNAGFGGGLTADVLHLNLTAGIDLGCAAAAGYPHVGKVDGVVPSHIWMRAGGTGTIGSEWDDFFAHTKETDASVFVYSDNYCVTSILDGVTWDVNYLWIGNNYGQGNVRLANGSTVTVNKYFIMGYNGSGPKNSSLHLEPGTTLRLVGTDAENSALVGQWSGAASGVDIVAVDNATLEVPNAPFWSGKDIPYAYTTIMNGGKFSASGLYSRVSPTPYSYPNGDGCFTMTSGSTVEVGKDGLGCGIVRPDFPVFDFDDGTLRATADWSNTYDWPQIAFGAHPGTSGKVKFDLNGNSVSLAASISGASEVELAGSGAFATDTRLQTVTAGKWTIDSGVTADLSGFSGFAGGLELDEDVTASVSLGVTGEDSEGIVEFAIGGFTLDYAVNNFDRQSPMTMRVDNMDQLHNYYDGVGPMQYSTFIFRGQFYVADDQAGTWYFAGTYDDNIYLEVDGEQVLYSQDWQNVGTGSRELTAGWHAFRAISWDAVGGQGPSLSAWNQAKMSLGWTTTAPSDATDPANYTRFDNQTLRMRPIPRTDHIAAVRIQQGDAQLNEGDWNLYDDLYANGRTEWYGANDQVTPSLQILNLKNSWTWGESRCSRFLGYFKVEDGQAGEWNFRGQWDDRIALRIDGEQVLATTDWNAIGSGSKNLDAGWHYFDIKVGDATGGWGPVDLTGKLSDGTSVDAGLVAQPANGSDELVFDERNFRIVASVYDVANDNGVGLGATTELKTGSKLVNLSTRGWYPIYGTVKGAGTLSGNFRFEGGTITLTGPGSHAIVPTFENPNANALADLGGVRVEFTSQPIKPNYKVGPALGLTAAQAAALPVTVALSGVSEQVAEKYANAFSCALIDGDLYVVNSSPAGMVVFVR